MSNQITPTLSDKEYKRHVRSWAMYDWASSAFSTTILAAVLPVYYSSVAGSTLSSRATATQYWSTTLTISVLIIALLSPILGTISDMTRGKKRFLALFLTLGVIGTSLLYLVQEGDWLMASLFMVIAYVGFGSANVFYDSLLPHIAKENDQDRVSSFGYAIGYLGGGLLLAINVVMIEVFDGTLGVRLSFISVAIWWAIFAMPLFLTVPEPEGNAVEKMGIGQLTKTTFKQLQHTMRNIRQFKHLFRFLIAFLVYNDGINAVISIAVIYGAELGFESTELILAILLVQFVGIPYSLIFGRLPRTDQPHQPLYVAFILYNLLMLPLVSISTRELVSPEQIGGKLPDYVQIDEYVGQGSYSPAMAGTQTGRWVTEVNTDGPDATMSAMSSNTAGNTIELPFNGQDSHIIYHTGPEMGEIAFLINGKEVNVVDAQSEIIRYDQSIVVSANAPGKNLLTIEHRSGKAITVDQITVQAPDRQSNLGLMLGILGITQLLGLVFAWVTGKRFFTDMANWLNTKRTIGFAITFYIVIAIWGFFLQSAVEFWFLAWMVATVQGGSQALSRSLYASMSPKAMSGEFFGFYSILSKFASFLSPLIFVFSVQMFDSSRPGILSLVLVFVIGLVLLSRVNVSEGRAVAQAENRRLAK